MSYDIYIGEAIIRKPAQEDIDDGYNRLDVRVEALEHVDAPTFPNDEMTGKGNHRHSGYSQWSGFCEEAGIHDLFFNKDDGLMREHPGCFLLLPRHLEAVRGAYKKRRKKYPHAVAGFGDREDLEQEIARGVGGQYEKKQREILAQLKKDGGEWDAILARLIWLDYWMAWALTNCKIPAIHNH